MSDANEQEQKRPLTLSRSGGRLELRKSVEMGQVRQSFSHGRSKTVTVEVRKKRTISSGPEPGRAEVAPIVVLDPALARPATQEPARQPMKKRADVLLSSKPTDGDKKKNRLRRRLVVGPRRKPVEKRKTRRGDGAPKKKPASGPSKRHSGAKTKSHGARWPSGRG